MKSSRKLAPAATVASLALLLTACGGSVGSDSQDGADGFAYGASQEDVNAAIADLEPVEITYQAAGQSPSSKVAISDLALQEYIEERSNGQISVNMVWGQAIAGYDEVDNALLDGRLDIAWTLPVYDPNQYPAFDSIVTATAGMPSSPVIGELIAEAVVADVAAGSPEVIAEYESLGLTPLLPMASSGAYHTMCAEDGTSLADWKGRTIRIANRAHEVQATALGGNPTSLPYTEMFEALQRGTIDCTFGAFRNSEEAGLLEVITHVATISDENSMSGRGTGAVVGGTGFQQLPLPYQQIIFDSMEPRFAASVESLAEGNAAGMEQLTGSGGQLIELDPETDALIGTTNEELIQGVEESGALESGIAERTQASIDKWSGLAEEMGYEEAGSYADLHEWFDIADFDFGPMSERFFEDVLLPMRPE